MIHVRVLSAEPGLLGGEDEVYFVIGLNRTAWTRLSGIGSPQKVAQFLEDLIRSATVTPPEKNKGLGPLS